MGFRAFFKPLPVGRGFFVPGRGERGIPNVRYVKYEKC